MTTDVVAMLDAPGQEQLSAIDAALLGREPRRVQSRRGRVFAVGRTQRAIMKHPLFVTSLPRGEQAPVDGDGPPSRDRLFIDDHARGAVLVLDHRTPGEVYAQPQWT